MVRLDPVFCLCDYSNHHAVSPYQKSEIKKTQLEPAFCIDDFKEDRRFFISTLTGERKPLTNLNLIWYGIRFPFITLKIITLIHWNAIRLWLKKIPYHKKAENQHLQQNVYRRK